MPAHEQTTVPLDKLLHSGNAGMILHRTGQFTYEFAAEGRQFSTDLLRYMNENQVGVMSTFCYEEVFGSRDRMHWLIHLRAPNEYGKVLHMVDHDEMFQEISLVDRLPEKGHGNWERMYVESSMRERFLVPQHGFSFHHKDSVTEEERANYVPAGCHQTAQPLEAQLNSATAGAIVLRTGNVRYEFREEGRLFLYDWQEYVNKELAGALTALFYEENFGQQDRLHVLIHLRDAADYWTLVELERHPAMVERIYRKQRIHESKGGGIWDRLFVQDSIHDTLMVPVR
jgi:hypothetical protein